MPNDLDIDLEALENRDQLNAKLDAEEGGATPPAEPKVETPVVGADGKVTEEPKPGEDPKPAEVTDADQGNAADDVDSDTAEILTQFRSSIETELGVEFTDEELSEIASSPDIQTASKLAGLGAKKLAQKLLQDELAASPDFEKAYNYIKAKGSLAGIEEKFSTPDYSQVDLTVEDNQKAMYKTLLTMQGLDSADADELVTVAVDKGTLKVKSEAAQKLVVEHYQEELDAKIAQDKQVIKTQQENDQKIFTEVTDFVKTGKIMGVTLSKEDQKSFTDFMFKPLDKTGLTARDKYTNEISIEKDMYIEYLKFKDFQSVSPKIDKKIATLKDLKNANAGRTNDVGSGRANAEFAQGSNEIDMEVLDLHLKGKRP